MTDIYLIWSHEHAMWWGPDGYGYTAHLSEAGRYTHDDVLHICTMAIPGTSTRLKALPELPVRLKDVEAMIARYNDEFGDRPEPWK
jgi:hypothetical protein